MPIFKPWVTWTLLNYICHSHPWSLWPPSAVLLFAGYTRSWKMRGSHARKFEILDPENGLFGKKNAACNVCFPLWRYKTFFLPFLHDPNNPANNLLFARLNKVTNYPDESSKYVTICQINPANNLFLVGTQGKKMSPGGHERWSSGNRAWSED